MNEDPFQPEQRIGSGPAAKLYRGVERATGRKILIKVLHDFETPHALDREKLQLLAPALLQMRHPQIAGLVTMVPTEDEFALIYDFMPGMNVRAFAAERRTSPADLRALAVQLMHALMLGEQLRQPHGDPKPANIIIADHPGGGLFAQVQDWGLSLARAEHPPETLWFRAPELHAGAPLTSQSDLFTTAASLFCLATNTAPAQGDDPAEIVQQWSAFDAGRTLHHLRPDLDGQFVSWLAWLLRPDPHQRPRSVAQSLEMLAQATPLHTGFVPILHAPLPVPPSAAPPKPVVSKPPPAVAVPPKGVPGSRMSGGRMFITAALNLAAFALITFFLWPSLRDMAARWRFPIPAPAGKLPATAADGSALKGRYVRIELPTKRGVLNLAEVQVFSGGENIAMKGKPTQSSVSNDGTPDLAIDGNTDGNMPKGKSVTHTHGNKAGTPWWQVDLGKAMPIHRIVIWNRTDGSFGDRTANLTIQVRDAQQKIIWEKIGLPKPDPALELAVGR